MNRGAVYYYEDERQPSNGHAAPAQEGIPLSQFNPHYHDDSVPRENRRSYEYAEIPPDGSMRPQSQDVGDWHGDHYRPQTRSHDEIRETAELLESLPSRQLESLATSGKHTLRNRHIRHKSFHGTVRLPHGVNAAEEISRTLEDDPDGLDRTEEEIESYLRGMATTLSTKREIKRHMSLRTKKTPARTARLKYTCGMGWQHFKYSVAELAYYMELWKTHLKKIEGHFGTGVTSYFLFLKWLFFINIPIFLLTFGFVIIPQILHRWFEAELPGYPSQNTSFTGVELLTGAGWFENSELYYGFYTSEDIEIFSGIRYRMIYAYLFTSGGYYLLCLLILANSILRSYRKYYIEGSGEFNFYYVSKVLCGWSYGITSQEAATLKHKSLFNELNEYLSGTKEKEKKTLEEKCQLFWTRVVTNFIVLAFLGGSGYLVYFISEDQSLTNTIGVLSLLALPLCITGINLILPFIFTLLEHLEKYEKPRNELYIHMLRTMTLRAVSLGVLIYFWFNKAPEEKNCWETFMGEEIYRLVIVDFIFTILFTFVFEFVRRIVAKYCWPSIGYPEFNIGWNTLDLIYSQTLCWLGTFYSPVLSCIMIVKLVIIFYVKTISVLQNCKPSMRPWRAARSHTIFLGFLFFFFLLTTAAVACGIIFVKPSKTCGPYKSYNTTYEVVIHLVDEWKGEQPWLADTIGFISSPGFIAGLLILLCMGTYYMRIAMIGHKEMVTLLKQQLSLEGKDKNFLLNLLQEVSKKNKDFKPLPTKRIREQDVASQGSSFTSPGGRAFIRRAAETAAMSGHG